MTTDETLQNILARLDHIAAAVDGIPLIHRKLSVIEQQSRMLKTAFNDFATVQVTSGEIQALHDDVNAVQAEHLQMQTQIATLTRRLDELEQKQ